MRSPAVVKAKYPSRCSHCNLPVDEGEPVTPTGIFCHDSPFDGWEHAYHHAASFEAAEAWGLYPEGDA